MAPRHQEDDESIYDGLDEEMTIQMVVEQSLREMLLVYTEATAAGDRTRARYCRRQVIAAKDRARFVSRDRRASPEKRAQKEEMVQWMLVWLENPAVFPAWVDARKRVEPPPA